MECLIGLAWLIVKENFGYSRKVEVRYGFYIGHKSNQDAANAAAAQAQQQQAAAYAAASKPNPLTEEISTEGLDFLKQFRAPNFNAIDLISSDPGLRGAKALYESGQKERAADTDIGLQGDTSQGSGQMLSVLRENQKNKRQENIGGTIAGAIQDRYNQVTGQQAPLVIGAEGSRISNLLGNETGLYNSLRNTATNYVAPPSFLEKFLLSASQGAGAAAITASKV